WSYLYALDPATKKVTRLAPSGDGNGNGFTLSRDATTAFVASSATAYPELSVALITENGQRLTAHAQRTLTSLGDQVSKWALGAMEVITWKSKDGAMIEGVLHKPIG